MRALTGFVFLACAAGAFAICKNLKPQPDLEESKVLGDWYEIAAFCSREESKLKCTKTTYSSVPENDYFKTVIQGVLPDGSQKVIEGNATRVDPEVPGKYHIIYEEAHFIAPILKTDYTSYLLCILCSEQEDKIVKIAIRSRTRKLPEEKVEELKKILQDEGIDTSKVVAVKQDDCE